MARVLAGGPVRAIAHRGDPVGHRENTLPAVRAALGLGADLVEIDVRITADGRVVLLHDRTLARLWGDPRPIAEVPYGELDPEIPLLAAALEVVAGTGTSLLIDMAAPELAAPSLRVVADAVAAGGLDADELAWCGDLGALQIVREHDPAARILLSWYGRVPPPDAVVAALAPEAYNPNWAAADPGVVAWARERALAMCCWTVDDGRVMGDLLDRGLDAVISNRIATLREIIDARA